MRHFDSHPFAREFHPVERARPDRGIRQVEPERGVVASHERGDRVEISAASRALADAHKFSRLRMVRTTTLDSSRPVYSRPRAHFSPAHGSESVHRAPFAFLSNLTRDLTHVLASVDHGVDHAFHAVERVEHAMKHAVIHEAVVIEKAFKAQETHVFAAVHTVQQTGESVVQRFEQAMIYEGEQIKQGMQMDAVHVRSVAAHAYQQAMRMGALVKQEEERRLRYATESFAHQGREFATGIHNVVAHPRQTAEAVMRLVGNGMQTGVGAVLAFGTAETGVGIGIGVAISADGAAKTVASAEDVASIWNGHENQVGTHNVLEQIAQKVGGRGGKDLYESISFSLSLVTPESAGVHVLEESAQTWQKETSLARGLDPAQGSEG
ncbi:hypothetical protein [Sulfoacidibacillus thermotolerans]|nr:hypothetical protein [Sulfoacidibacillus thermotolerans]